MTPHTSGSVAGTSMFWDIRENVIGNILSSSISKICRFTVSIITNSAAGASLGKAMPLCQVTKCPLAGTSDEISGIHITRNLR